MPKVKKEKQEEKSKKEKANPIARIASKLARTASQLAKIETRLAKWNIDAKPVSTARESILAACAGAQKLAEGGWTPPKKASKVPLAEGAKVRIKAKVLGEYDQLLTAEELADLQVAMVKNGKVFVRIGPQGSKKALGFTPRGHLEVVA